MPEEPKHPVEDLLEAHALQRRAEGGSFELHPASRELLRGEALRVHAQKAPEPRSNPDPETGSPARSAWFLLWTRLVGAFAIVGLLGIAVVVVQQLVPAPEMELALNRSDATPKAEREGHETLSARSVGTTLLADSTEELSPTPLSVPVPEPQAEVVPPPRPATALKRIDAPSEQPVRNGEARQAEDLDAAGVPTRRLASREPNERAETKAIADATPAPASVQAAARDSTSGIVFQRVGQANGLRRNMQSPALPDVLSAFRVSLLGNRLRLEEEDGSVYLGDLAADGTSFSVTGTNVSHGERVRFVGRAALAPRIQSDGRRSTADTPTLTVPVVLEGTVALGERQQWRLRAEARP